MLEPSSFRDRLGAYVYLEQNQDNPLYRLETLLAKASEMEVLWRKFQNAVRNLGLPPFTHFDEQVKAVLLKVY